MVLVAWLLIALLSPWARRLTDQVDAAVLRSIAELRNEWLTTIARGIDRMATGWTLSAVIVALLVTTVVCKRWRHLFTFLGAIVVLNIVGVPLIYAFHRPRPYDVTTIGRWEGFSLPSATAGYVATIVVCILYMAVVPGRPRRIGKVVGAVVVLAVVGSRLYLAVDHPFDVLVGVALGVSIPLVGFRFFTPNDVVPGHVPRRQDGPPRHRRAARRSAAPRRRGATRRDGRRRPPGRPRRIGRVDAAAPAPRRAIRTGTCSGSSTR